MLLSKSVGYAIRAVLYISAQEGMERKVGIKELAEALEVPQPFLGKIMQELVRREVVSSTKGPNGGFYPNEQTHATSMLKIVDIIDGLGMFQKCALGMSKCSGTNPCPLHRDLIDWRDSLQQRLASRTIAELLPDFQEGKTKISTD